MALSTIVLAWFDHMAAMDLLPPGPLLELGPQDIIAARPIVEQFLRRRLPAERAEDAIGRIYSTTTPERPQAEIYRALGFSEYVSVDFGDDRADVQHDLNRPLDLDRRFAAVTNIGTAEHVFEVAEVFRTQYRHLDVNGVALFLIPAFGELNHGFYNVHPTLWTDLAVANAMEIADFCYVDNINRRSKIMETENTCQFDFESLPIKPVLGQYGSLFQRVAINYFRNTGEEMKMAVPGQFPLSVMDCCLVALRRTADSPKDLQIPQQAIYAPPEVRDAASKLRPIRPSKSA